MKRYNVHLDDDQVFRLKAIAKIKGSVVAELIRRYIENGILKDETRNQDQGPPIGEDCDR